MFPFTSLPLIGGSAAFSAAPALFGASSALSSFGSSLWNGLNTPLGGSLLAGALDFGGAYYQNRSARAAAERQMAFQLASAQNAYQWATADMRKAGINPMLAYQRGGSSALSGATYQPQNLTSGLAASAREMHRVNSALDNLKADTFQKKENAYAQAAAANLAREQRNKVFEETKITRSQQATAKAEADQARIMSRLLTQDGKVGELAKIFSIFRNLLFGK